MSNRNTPSKLSSAYKKLKVQQRNSPAKAESEKKPSQPIRVQASGIERQERVLAPGTGRSEPVVSNVIILISSSDDDEAEEENVTLKKSCESLIGRNSRRNSTILAGNLTVLDSDEEDEDVSRGVSIFSNQSYTRRTSNHSSRKGRDQGKDASRPLPLQEITEDEENDLITEDETNFYSCEEGQDDPMNRGGVLDTWISSDTIRSVINLHQDAEKEKSRLSEDKRIDTETESLELVLSETTCSEVRYKNTPGIILSTGNLSQSMEKTPTNKFPSAPQSSTVKASRLFSLKKNTFTPGGVGRIIIGGSDSESDDDQPLLQKCLSFNKYRDGNRTVINSDDDLPSPNSKLLSDSKLHRVNSWLSNVSDPAKRRDSCDSLLDSTLEVEEGGRADITEDLSPEPTGSQGTSKHEGSWRDETENTHDNRSESRSHRGAENTNEGGKKSVNSSHQRQSEGTSKVGRSWRNDSQSQATSNSDNSQNISQSQGTSKAGGTWNNDSQSQGTSKAGGTWNNDSQSQGTSKAEGSWNCDSQSQGTNKAGGTWNYNSQSQGTSKAGGSWNNDSQSQGTSKTDGTWNNNSQSQGTSKTDGTWNNDSQSQGTSKAGGSWNNDSQSQGTSKAGGTWNNDSQSQGTSKDGGSWNNDSQSQGNSKAGGTRNNVSQSQGTSKTNGSLNNDSLNIGTSKAGGSWRNKSNSQGKHVSSNNQSRSFSDTDRFVPLTYHSMSRSPNGSVKGKIVYGNDSVEYNQTLENPVVQKKTKRKPPVLGESTIRTNMTIDNSVNAVRSWTQVETQVSSVISERKEMQAETSSEDDLEGFLNNLKISRTVKKKVVSDDEFIVPDDELDSSDPETPELSLMDRIRRRKDGVEEPKTKKKTAKKTKSKTKPAPNYSPDSSGELPSPDPVRTKTKKPLIDSDDSDSDSLVRTQTKKSARKKNVIVSDSESSITVSSDSEGSVSPTPIKSKKPTKKTTSTIEGKPKDKPVNPEDFHTPKPKKSTQKLQLQEAEVLGTPRTLTFLSSLTIDTPRQRCHPDALKYISDFKKKKEELSKRLYHLYNKEIFDGCLPADMEITWNVRLTKTAGLCYSKRYRNKFNIEARSSRIELSVKVLDSGDRLRDTLIHEMCHAASWIISGYRDGHGPLWRTWAEKAMSRFPELPVIDRCHSYQIRTKYSYVCENCGYQIDRHSKSLDTERKVCGHCHGKFRLLVNTSNKENSRPTPGPPKTPNAFALFVKENYKVHKKPGVQHKDVMSILSQEFAKVKLKNGK